jgi:hypothetical protein
MSSDAGKKALAGDWVEIGAELFEITEDMLLSFEGRSCNIQDEEGNLVKQLGEKDGKVEDESVLAGYRCFVMKAFVKFEKK